MRDDQSALFPPFRLPRGDHLGEWIFLDRGQTEGRNLLQPPPSPCDPLLLLRHKRRVELILGESTLATYRLEMRIDNELCQRRVAADVSLPQDVQLFGRHLAEDITQVQIGIGDPLYVATADFAQIPLLTQPMPALLRSGHAPESK